MGFVRGNLELDGGVLIKCVGKLVVVEVFHPHGSVRAVERSDLAKKEEALVLGKDIASLVHKLPDDHGVTECAEALADRAVLGFAGITAHVEDLLPVLNFVLGKSVPLL